MITRLKRYPWLSLCTFGAFIVLCGLSYWQMQRLYWKQHFIQNMTETLAAPPLVITSGKQFQNLPEFRRVQVEGTLLNNETLHLQARYYQSNLGFHLITPLKLSDGTYIFINRGWVPKDYKTNPKVKISQPKGEIQVIGLVRGTETPRSYLPQNDAGQGLWLWQDPESWAAILRQKLPNKAIFPVLIQQTHNAREDNGFPIPQKSNFEVRNDHLQYAITWGSFAVILLIIYGVFTAPKRKA